MPTPRARVRRHASATHPWVTFLCGLCLLSGIPLLLGRVEPDSIQATLNPTARVLWAAMLTVGSAAVLAGTWWPGQDRDALLVEQIGQVAVAAGTIVYAAALLTVIGLDALLSAAIVLGFGLACLWRVWLIRRALHTMRVRP